MALFEILFACFLALLGLASSVLTTVYTDWVHHHPWVGYAGWVCLALSFCFLLAAVAQWKRVHSTLTIHYAIWYGDRQDKSLAKTDIVRGWIVDNRIHHHVHQEELGDIPPKEAKKLEVCFSLGAIKRKIRVTRNDSDLKIPDASLV